MLTPKRTKYRKTQKGRMKGISQRGHRLSNGMFGIKSLESKESYDVMKSYQVIASNGII